MLSRGFAFESHLAEGRGYYRTVFAVVPARAETP
jgi:hypothetical protein